jgi:hypothetical protein
MFTQECFIRKNTKELQDKLRKLGYDICCCCYFKGAVWLDTNTEDCSVHGIGYIGEELEYMGIDTLEKSLNFFLSENEKSENKSIDCGENEDLFLAIASLRDDTNKNQWFVWDDNKDEGET